MTVTIKLDASAIRELFPEGSESRLELSRAVIAETIRKMDSKIIGQLTKAMTEEMKPVLDQMETEARDYANKLLDQGFYDKPLSEATKEKIKTFIGFHFGSLIEQAAKSALEPLLADQKKIDDKLEYIVDSKLKASNAYISQKANQLLAAKIDAIINNVMEKQ